MNSQQRTGAAIVVLALLACKKSEPSVRTEPRQELAIHTIPLELGEGDSREGSVLVKGVQPFGTVAIAVGTRIERLKDNDDVPEGMGRVRMLDGDRKGDIGFARLDQIQAAR